MAATKRFGSEQRVTISESHPKYGGQRGTLLATVYYMDSTCLWVRIDGDSPILIEEEFLEASSEEQ
jgi:hypothetical protein